MSVPTLNKEQRNELKDMMVGESVATVVKCYHVTSLPKSLRPEIILSNYIVKNGCVISVTLQYDLGQGQIDITYNRSDVRDISRLVEGFYGSYV